MKLTEIKVTNGINRFSSNTTVHNSFKKACEKVNLILNEMKKAVYLYPMEFIELEIKFSNGYKGKYDFSVRNFLDATQVDDLRLVITTSLEGAIWFFHSTKCDLPELFENDDRFEGFTKFLDCLKGIGNSSD